MLWTSPERITATRTPAKATAARTAVRLHTSTVSAVDLNMNPRVAVYARQSVKVDEGVARQVELANAHAQSLGWVVIDTYLDNSVSATKARGPESQWARMLQDIDQGRVDTVVVVAIDRLLRRQADIFHLVEPTRKVRVVAIRNGIDTGTSTGKMTMGILVSVAEAEIDTKSERALPYRQARRAAGHPNAGRTVYGYRWVPQAVRGGETRYVVDERERVHVRYMFEETLGGASIGSIVRHLNDAGQTTRQGKPWLSSTVRRILLNPFLAGLLPPAQTLRYDSRAVDLDACTIGAWEPIVTRDELVAVRARLMNPKRKKQRGNDRRWLLSGLAICDVCGGSVISCRTKDGDHGYRCKAGHFQRKGNIIDQAVADLVVSRLSLPDARDLLKPKDTVDVPALLTRQKAIEARVQSLVDFVADGTFSASDIKERKSLLDIEAATVEQELADALTNDPLAEVITAEDVRAKWDALSLSRQREVVRLICTPVIHRVGKGVRVRTLDQADHTLHYQWALPVSTNPPALPIDRAALGGLLAR